MTGLRIFVGVLGIALLAVILWAAFAGGGLHGTFLDQFGVVMTLPWGVGAIADLYIGFALFAVIVFLAERSWLTALLWALPIFVVGNIWTALWLALRLPSLARRLNRPDLQES
ncbi:MAG: hypothetical protein JNM47_10955 [Hyphomonadaceae bacterium]|nr:hypothetical protein [Hyphomonadaceae bacterium]